MSNLDFNTLWLKKIGCGKENKGWVLFKVVADQL